MPEVVIPAEIEAEEDDERDQMLDIWSSIQMNNEKIVEAPASLYLRQSSGLMSQSSLEICTESLMSETGSYEFSGDELNCSVGDDAEEEAEEAEEAEEEEQGEYMEMERKDFSNVNYHCSIGRRSPAKSFPPPLPSISRRDGFCFKMQPRRHDGRLILESVPVPCHNYLHAERHGGRLLLSFIETSSQTNSPVSTITRLQYDQKENGKEEEEVDRGTEEEEDDDKEVELVDRGTILEVKIRTQPPPAYGTTGMLKVPRSSLLINKFVVGSPHMTAAAAALTSNAPLSPAAAASSDSKLLFTSKRRSREELLHDMRRCSELRRLLFIFEQPYCIATS